MSCKAQSSSVDVGGGDIDVLLTRMRGAQRTMEKLRDFWKERATIEEEYAKRLAKLATTPLGRNEIGVLRDAIDVIRAETDKQAGIHAQFARWTRASLEEARPLFAEQRHRGDAYETTIRTMERRVVEAREKDAAQSMLMLRTGLDEVGLELEHARQTVEASENEYARSARVLRAIMHKWQQDRRTFCDSCQGLEKEQMEFMKDLLWAVANAVSTSCKKLRVALGQVDTAKEMVDFVRAHGTGKMIPEPPEFVDYAKTNAPLASSPTSLPFVLPTQIPGCVATLPQSEDVYERLNRAGVGTGGPPCTFIDVGYLSRSVSQTSAIPTGANGHVPPSRGPHRNQSIVAAPAKPLSGSDPADPNKDLLQQNAVQSRTSPPVYEHGPLVQMAPSRTPSTTSTGATSRDSSDSGDVDIRSLPFIQAPSCSPSSDLPMFILTAPLQPVRSSIPKIPAERIVSGCQRPLSGEPLVLLPLSSARHQSPTMTQSDGGHSFPSSASSVLERGMSVSRQLATPSDSVGLAHDPHGRNAIAHPTSHTSVGSPPVRAQPLLGHPAYDARGPLTRPRRQVQPPSPSRNDFAVVAPTKLTDAEFDDYDHIPPPAYDNHIHPPAYDDHVATDMASPRSASAAACRSTSPGSGGSPAPAAERGQPILFYVKALYDYSATVDEEFDFQVGDIIAVTDAHENGWWSGELLDDTRQQAGRHVFPSNFVCVF